MDITIKEEWLWDGSEPDSVNTCVESDEEGGSIFVTYVDEEYEGEPPMTLITSRGKDNYFTAPRIQMIGKACLQAFNMMEGRDRDYDPFMEEIASCLDIWRNGGDPEEVLSSIESLLKAEQT